MKKAFLTGLLLLGTTTFLNAQNLFIYQLKVDSVFSVEDRFNNKDTAIFQDYTINFSSPTQAVLIFPKEIIMNNGKYKYEAKNRTEKIYFTNKLDENGKREEVKIKDKGFIFNLNGFKFKDTSFANGFKKVMALTASGKVKSF